MANPIVDYDQYFKQLEPDNAFAFLDSETAKLVKGSKGLLMANCVVINAIDSESGQHVKLIDFLVSPVFGPMSYLKVKVLTFVDYGIPGKVEGKIKNQIDRDNSKVIDVHSLDDLKTIFYEILGDSKVNEQINILYNSSKINKPE